MDVDNPSWSDDAQPIEITNLDGVADEAIKRAILYLYRQQTQLRREVEERWAADDRAWCLSEESRDAVVNETRMDTLCFIGTSYSYNGTENPGAMYQACTDLIATVVDPQQCQKAGESGMVHILKVHHLNKVPGARPILEVKFDSKATAAMVRRCFLTKVRDNPMPGVTMAPAVTTGTRVRIEILKAIAKKLKSTGQEAFCVQHVARPILAVINSGLRTNFSYIEAATKFGSLMNQSEFEAAYKRLLGSFPGRAKSIFLLLNESGRSPHQPTSKKRSYRVAFNPSGPWQPRPQRPRFAATLNHPPPTIYHPQQPLLQQQQLPPPQLGPQQGLQFRLPGQQAMPWQIPPPVNSGGPSFAQAVAQGTAAQSMSGHQGPSQN
jgi:hypothetical protein